MYSGTDDNRENQQKTKRTKTNCTKKNKLHWKTRMGLGLHEELYPKLKQTDPKNEQERVVEVRVHRADIKPTTTSYSRSMFSTRKFTASHSSRHAPKPFSSEARHCCWRAIGLGLRGTDALGVYASGLHVIIMRHHS